MRRPLADARKREDTRKVAAVCDQTVARGIAERLNGCPRILLDRGLRTEVLSASQGRSGANLPPPVATITRGLTRTALAQLVPNRERAPSAA